ncbi:MAG: Acetylornithine aminotransferase [Clostridia bacterium 41_269]|nr:MAG: Acetylornithine aminotransferase [Clostridia bacterium 41_269]
MGNDFIRRLGEKYLMKNYTRQPVALVKGEGVHVWDAEGNKYMDFVGGLAVNSLGHCDPEVVESAVEQLKKLIHCSNLYWTEPQVELAQLLVENSDFDRVFFCNSGAEANEAAFKLARRYFQVLKGSRRYKIITMYKSFHGRTLAAAAATGQEKVHTGFDPLPPGFVHVPFNDIEALEKAVDDETCAVMLEPIQGEGGINAAKKEYMKEVERICRENGILLMVDEIQCGMGRTGKLFAYEHYEIKPHVVTLAKALGGGLPIGAVLAVEEVSRAFGPGSHGSTFGGNPVSCAAGAAVVNALFERGLIKNAAQMGSYLYEKLEDLKEKYGFIEEVRGLGLMLGMELSMDGSRIVDLCRKRGLLINCASEKVLRFLPPLNITREHVDRAVEILDEVLDSISKEGEDGIG